MSIPFSKILLFSVLVNCIFLLQSCNRDAPSLITENDFENLELNDFVEPDFPFIHTSLDLRNIGEKFPENNYSSRVIATRLGNQSYMAFDPDMLRWAVAWTGDFVSMKGVAQVSYKDYFNKGDGFPTILGKPVLATGIYPGWTDYFPDFKDPRSTINESDSLTWGPVSQSIGRWQGTHTINNNIVVEYKVGETPIYDFPSSHKINNEVIFSRKLKILPFPKTLYHVLAELNFIDKAETKDNVLFIHQGKDVSLFEVKSSSGKITLVSNKYVVLELNPQSQTSENSIFFWSGKNEKVPEVLEAIKSISPALPDLKNGGNPYWQETMLTKGKVAPDTAAFVLDQLILPVPNLWKRNVRVADIAFFKNGNAAVLTFEGDVWILKHINKSLNQLEWSRYASGFFEAMSIEIFQDKIYVFGREGVIKLHDLNHDGNADYYENYVDDIIQSIDSREWAADMAFDKKGNIYLAKGGGTIPSAFPSIAKNLHKQFRSSTIQAGSILRTSPNGQNTEIFATGLRLPYLGLNPETGFLTASDQQGNYVPASPVYHIIQGKYYGVLPANHQTTEPEIQKPITWIPHRIDQSSISQFWITSRKMGPLNRSMVHISFGRPGIFTVLQDKFSVKDQGGVVAIKADYPAPLLKGGINPKDGQLYIAGFNLWGSNSNGLSALVRLRYTHQPYYLPVDFQAGKQGIMLKFAEKLDKNSIKDVNNYRLKRWNYLRTEKYGSGHYLLNGEPGEETLPVLEAHLGSDEKSVLLIIPNMAEVMQMELDYSFQSKKGVPVQDEFYFTVNCLDPLHLEKAFKSVKIDNSKLSLSQKQLDEFQNKSGNVSVDLGKELFQKYACIGCHSLNKSTEGKYGPSLAGLYNSERQFTDGYKTIANDNYIRESIKDSKARIVKGFGDEMPSYTGVLKDYEIESLMMYIKTL